MEPRNFLDSFEVVLWENKVARRTPQSCWVLTYPTEFPNWTNWPIWGENQKSSNFQTSSMTVNSPAQDYLLSILFINYFSDSPDKNVYFNLKWMLKLNYDRSSTMVKYVFSLTTFKLYFFFRYYSKIHFCWASYPIHPLQQFFPIHLLYLLFPTTSSAFLCLQYTLYLFTRKPFNTHPKNSFYAAFFFT